MSAIIWKESLFKAAESGNVVGIFERFVMIFSLQMQSRILYWESGIQLIFGGSGIVPAAVAAIALNVLFPKEKDEEQK